MAGSEAAFRRGGSRGHGPYRWPLAGLDHGVKGRGAASTPEGSRPSAIPSFTSAGCGAARHPRPSRRAARGEPVEKFGSTVTMAHPVWHLQVSNPPTPAPQAGDYCLVSSFILAASRARGNSTNSYLRAGRQWDFWEAEELVSASRSQWRRGRCSPSQRVTDRKEAIPQSLRGAARGPPQPDPVTISHHAR